jgi:hypothetical protein
MKIRLAGAEFSRADGMTDGYDEVIAILRMR